MAAGTNERSLGDAAIGTYGDRLKVEDPGVDADPHVVTQRQLPRPMDFDTVPDLHSPSNGSAKGPKYAHT